MGSGCISGTGLPSNVLKPTPDTSVIYTGIPIPALGVCPGDLLSEVEAVILQKILDYSTAVGISVPSIDLTQCDCFKKAVGCCGAITCQTLTCILQAYLDCMCNMYTEIQILDTKVAAMYDGPYIVDCLTANSSGIITSASKLPAIVQELIKEFCALYAQVQIIQTTLNNFLSTGLNIAIGDFLNTHITTCQTDSFIKSGSGASFNLTLKGGNPIGAIIMYGGPLSIFDSNGRGYNPGPACGWQLCNGYGGVVDMRGYAPVGVNDGTMGGQPQNSIVNNSLFPGQAYSFNAFGGSINVSLNSTNIPAMAVSGTTTPTTGNLGFYTVSRKHASTGDNTMGYMCDGGGTSTPCPSDPNGNISFTIPAVPFTASVGASGTPTPVDNRQPYRAIYFIQRIS